jgi:hypothetical protein
MEVKKKFRKDGIELGDARQNISRERYFAGASGFSWRRRLAGDLSSFSNTESRRPFLRQDKRDAGATVNHGSALR